MSKFLNSASKVSFAFSCLIPLALAVVGLSSLIIPAIPTAVALCCSFGAATGSLGLALKSQNGFDGDSPMRVMLAAAAGAAVPGLLVMGL